jgi:hypothetical protein
VRKTRTVRTVQLDRLTGQAQEVDAQTFVDRSLGIELTDLDVAGNRYCSLAFEAFPDDSAMAAAFTETVAAFVDGLTAVALTAAQSQSYPAFLGRVLAV